MSEFPYASIPDYQKWTVVSDAADRSALSPQGPVKFTLPRHAKIASAGSCFGQRLAERLPGLGLDCLVAEPAGAPFSARWGTIYNVRHLQQLLERALERFAPLERAWLTAEGRFIDPFRPSVEPAGFSALEALEEDRRRHLAAVRQLFTELDLFIFTLGLTEYWSDVRDGAVFPMCPGRGRGVFDSERYVHRNADVAETCAALDGFIALLGEINPGARVVLTVSPVPIAATLAPMHVVRASVLTKSILKVAAETAAAKHDTVDYFATYDLVTANLGGETLYAADGRHVVDAVADRVTRLFAATYFGLGDAPQPATADETARLAAVAGDCDEDRLLALLSAERARAATPGPRAEAASVEHPIPLFFVGDSGSVTFRDSLYRFPQYPDTFVGRGLHTPGLYAGELADEDGRLNAAVVAALVSAGVLRTECRDAYSVQPDYNRMLGLAGDLRTSPPVTLFCGSLDANRLWTSLDSALIEIPAALGRGAWLPHRADDVPFDEAAAIALGMLERFELGLRVLKSYGLQHLAVHMIPPLAEEPAPWHANPWHDLIGVAQRASIVMNHCIARICERVGVVHVDIWPEVTRDDGWRDPRYTLDAGHLNFEASALSVGRLLDAFAAQPGYAHV
jgi:hypothetical protein